MSDAQPAHVPVLPAAVVDCLASGLPGVLVDCTLGLGGHTALLLESDPRLQVIGIDKDAENLDIAGRRLLVFGDRVRLIREDFADLESVLAEAGIRRVGGILADLGLSSNQLEDPARGFSFEADGPLDMRLDRSQRTTAADLVNGLREGELSDLLYLQSQEPHSRRIARRICQARRQGRLNSTVELARLVAAAVGVRPDSRRSRIHPATRTFMALRMSVNRETDRLEKLLASASTCLLPGGRVAIISFHSVEDRIVKFDFRRHAREGTYRLLTKKPVVATRQERSANPRSRSAKLRVAELQGSA